MPSNTNVCKLCRVYDEYGASFKLSQYFMHKKEFHDCRTKFFHLKHFHLKKWKE